MKRAFALALAALGFASAAQAATLTITADQAVYNVGDTVTLTVTGDSQGASSLAIFGRLLFSGSGVVDTAPATPTQTTLLALGSLPWTAGPLTCNSFSCDMMNQLSAFGLSPAPASNLLVATVSFLLTGPGTVNISWETDPSTGFQLDFFGLTNAPGTSFFVPEPATGALLGIGLAGLAAARRRAPPRLAIPRSTGSAHLEKLTMKSFAAALAVLAFASAAGAATLTVTPDQAFYNVGETITLTVTGDSQGASSLAIFGRLLFSNPSIVDTTGSAPTQTTLLALGSLPWTAGPLTCNSFSCDMMNQLSAFGLSPAPASNLLISTVTLIAASVGTSDVNWSTALDGFQLDFFGLTNAPGTIIIVPEPATALLLGVGLAGLATARRRS